MRIAYVLACLLCFAWPVYAQAPAESWSGAHVGVGFGGAFGSAKSEPSDSLALASGFGSVFGGYDREFNNGLVLGLEGGISPFPGLFGSGTRACPPALCGSLPASNVFHTQVDWFGDVRARIGYDAGRFMPYLTAGVGFGEATSTVNTMLFGHAVAPQQTIHSNLFGPLVGIGAQYRLAPHVALDVLAVHFSSGVNRIPGGHMQANAFRIGILYKF